MICGADLSRSTPRQPLRQRHVLTRWLLIATLLYAQWALPVHQSDLDAHHAGDDCQVCLHATALGHGAVDTNLTAEFPYARALAPEFSTAVVLPTTTRAAYIARAPPAAASI